MTDDGLLIGEEWRPVVGFDGLYEVSSLGRIRSLPRDARSRNRWGEYSARRGGGIIASTPGPSGYRLAQLSRGGRISARNVHTLVAAAFIGPAPEGQEVCHRDGVRANCSLHNLYYGTPKQNAEDRDRHGRTVRGENHSFAKLTDAAVRAIRAEVGQKTQRALAAEYGVSPRAIQWVVRGGSWRHVSDAPADDLSAAIKGAA